ncbi:DUF2285 domain-containing protein [Sphingomonas sp. GlSt437]|uniref:DUF2285 domain-containing protein n=1 Tax=Sphingomonas TaxID=13687 RepID=UPI003A85FD3C
MCWPPELVATTIVLAAAPDGFLRAKPVDPAALGPLLADLSGPNGRHVILADAEGEHRLWIRDAAPGQPLGAFVPLDPDFETRITSLLRFYRRLLGRRSGAQPRGWPLTAQRRDRLERMLRALDMRLAGASHREIAAAFGHDKAARLPATQWKVCSARSAVVRLVRDAERKMNRDYLKLLRIR